MEGGKKKKQTGLGANKKKWQGHAPDRVRKTHTSLARSLWRSPSACQAIDFDKGARV